MGINKEEAKRQIEDTFRRWWSRGANKSLDIMRDIIDSIEPEAPKEQLKTAMERLEESVNSCDRKAWYGKEDILLQYRLLIQAALEAVAECFEGLNAHADFNLRTWGKNE